MSMNREEAINRIENHMEVHGIGEYPHIALKEALDMAITALRPVSRERVEKVWRGEWIIVYDEDKEITIATCSKCGDETAYGGSLKADDCDAFCPVCGAPMTDEAVQMVMERLEALHENIYNG